MEVEHCTRCQIKTKDTELLEKIAYYRERSSHWIINEACNRSSRSLGRETLKEKFEKIYWEWDVERALKEYLREGYIDIRGGNISITQRGVEKLASNALEKVLMNLSGKVVGSHPVEEVGFGSELSIYSRRYEAGDDYYLVDVERTILHALERTGKLELKPEDFQVYEESHQTRLCVGLLIDESGSMDEGHKLSAAIETSLALSKLIGREPHDWLRVFIFSEQVREIPPWNIVSEMLGGGWTDIRAAMRAFRIAARNEKGDKQVYLVTDTAPNFEDGQQIDPDKAFDGVMEEALHYRHENITLNIIMLEQGPFLKRWASILARNNLGRVFFTSPLELGKVVIEDYLRVKKGRI